tara:strand:+ start:987 stop:1328 length:342 start_codon:yes stop_codon:yes gene_type:complete
MSKEIRAANKTRRQAKRARKKEIKKVGVENFSIDGYHTGEYNKKGVNIDNPEKRYSKKNPPKDSSSPLIKRFMGINPDHKGYCTPMTKSTCTPPRKALAKRLKPGGDLYKGKK